ncbi:MAG: fumarylacetoacetate hydrolase family protein [Alphaproteobacteria bacterium]|nr:fumarylacetoacetate hydrolase family protein [Alphaproteobacteria bacterium]
MSGIDRRARVRDADGRPWAVRVHGTPVEQGDAPLAGLRFELAEGDLLGELRGTGRYLAPDRVTLLPPVMPGKIVGIGSNYRAHAAELGRALPTVPKMFLKPSSAVVGPGAPIELPPGTERVDHEAELALVVGRTLQRVSPAEALDGLAGVTCLCDVTARDLQQLDGVFARAKGFDSFCPLGPWLVRGLDPRDLAVRLHLQRGGAWSTVQDGRSSDMVFGPAELLSFVSGVMTLYPGDVIATGTPAGVGPLVAGDRVQVFVEGVGLLDNPVRNRVDRPEST